MAPLMATVIVLDWSMMTGTSVLMLSTAVVTVLLPLTTDGIVFKGRTSR